VPETRTQVQSSLLEGCVHNLLSSSLRRELSHFHTFTQSPEKVPGEPHSVQEALLAVRAIAQLTDSQVDHLRAVFTA